MTNNLFLSAAAVPSAPSVTLSKASIVTEESVTLTCTPPDSAAYLYSWLLGGTGVPSETSPTFTISSATTSDGGVYTCTVTDGQGLTSAASAAETLTVTGW